MKKPTLAEVKEYFKDALEVRCASDEKFKINIINISEEKYFYYTGKYGLNHSEYAVLWNDITGFAEITKYKDYTTRYSDKEVNGKHYKTDSIDVIDFCKLYNLNFNRGSIVKYVCRAGLKKYDGLSLQESEIKDLKKAIDFLQRELKHLNNN